MRKSETSWTITSETAKEKVMKAFPMLKNECTISKGRMCYLTGCKPEMQMGFVFSLQRKGSGIDAGCVIFYPMNEITVRKEKKVVAYPVEKWDGSLKIENGYATVEFFNGEPVMVFNQYQ